MREAAASGVAEAHVAGVRPRVREQLAHVLPRRVGLHGERDRLAGERGHARERGVVELHVAGVVGGADAVGVPHQRVAVGRLALHVRIAERAAGAGAVDDGHGLAEVAAGQLGELAREEIGRAAGAKEHRQLERLVGKRGGRRRRREHQRDREGEPMPHGFRTTLSGSPIRFSSTSNASWTRLSGNWWVMSGLAVRRPAASSASARPTLVPPSPRSV